MENRPFFIGCESLGSASFQLLVEFGMRGLDVRLQPQETYTQREDAEYGQPMKLRSKQKSFHL